MNAKQQHSQEPWGAMAIGNDEDSAVIYHWQSTKMSSDAGIGDYVELRAYRRALGNIAALRAENAALKAEGQRLREALKVAQWWLDEGDDDFMPPWAGSALDHSEQQEHVRQTLRAALAGGNPQS